MESSANQRVSVITTCKGRLHHLKQSLPAMLAQECPFGYEVIVVDYGCPDGTSEWCLEQQDPRVKVARVLDGTEYFSPSRARNCGAWLAEGSVLAFVDADIVLAPEWLARTCEPILAGICGLCHTRRCAGCRDRNGTLAVSAELFHRVRGYDEGFEGWGTEVGDFYGRIKKITDFDCYPVRMAEAIRHGNCERTCHFREKSILASLRRNDEYVARREGEVNLAGYGIAQVCVAELGKSPIQVNTGAVETFATT